MDVIVVDGGSEDRTVEVAKAFQQKFSSDASLRVMSSQRGISRQRNAGAEIAKQELLIFMDADVVIPNAKLYERMIGEFVQSSYVVAMPGLVPREATLLARCMYSFFMFCIRTVLYFGKPYFSGSCLLTRKTIFSAIGGFNIDILIAEDVDYSFRASRLGRAGYLSIDIPVSARRFIQYGYWNMFWLYFKEGIIFLVTGVPPYGKALTLYPFGEYDH
jgi:glycosyltransferase involved in cell wall biosynthesis